jgi:CDP-diacylglycerol--glycerol-3-phosphate 3-phosphatidyltransferase
MGTARPFGLVVNEAGDRVADAAMLLGTAPAVGLPLALGSVAAATFVSLSGVLSLALTSRRDTGGPMGKADRVAALAVAAGIAAAVHQTWAFSVVLWAVVLGGPVTVVARLARLRRTLAHPSSGEPLDAVA